MVHKIYISYTDELTERDALKTALAIVEQTSKAERKGIITTDRSIVFFPERAKHLTMQIGKKR